jgi:hypothetical protein
MDGTHARNELKQGCKGMFAFHKLRVTHRGASLARCAPRVNFLERRHHDVG